MTLLITALVCVFAALAASAASPSPRPAASALVRTRSEIYCSGIVSQLGPRQMGYVISGEDGIDKLQFFQGDDVYLHLATRSVEKTGEQFLVVRSAKDPLQIPWFRGEQGLAKRMGRLWEDVGSVRVVKMAGKVAIARVESSCIPMERGDLLQTFQPRPSPPLPATQLKQSPPGLSAGSATGRVVSAKDFRQVLGTGYVAYVNLGTRQGARPGDRLVFFRYPGSADEEVYQSGETAKGIEGFGRSRGHYGSHQLPPEILGEGLVLRVSPTAATVLITSSRREIDLGAYAELE